jgi:hypothetical protein
MRARGDGGIVVPGLPDRAVESVVTELLHTAGFEPGLKRRKASGLRKLPANGPAFDGPGQPARGPVCERMPGKSASHGTRWAVQTA